MYDTGGIVNRLKRGLDAYLTFVVNDGGRLMLSERRLNLLAGKTIRLKPKNASRICHIIRCSKPLAPSPYAETNPIQVGPAQ